MAHSRLGNILGLAVVGVGVYFLWQYIQKLISVFVKTQHDSNVMIMHK